MEQRRNDEFATTHWTMVVSAREEDSDIRRASLGELCERYWYPLFAYLRRKGHDPDAAADYVQGFFSELIDKDFLKSVSEDEGRFRWFLMSAIKRFVSKEIEKEQAQKRGGDRILVSLDVDDAEQRYQLEPIEGWSAEKLFDRRWALTVLEKALQELKSDQEAKGKMELYEALQPTLSGIPMTGEQYAEIGERFNMIEGAVKVAALRLRQKYGQIIRRIVSETVVDRDGIASEIDDLFAALGG